MGLNPLKPCSSCLRTRQRVKHIASALSRRGTTPFQQVTCTEGSITIQVSNSIVTEVTGDSLDFIKGIEVYVAGKWVYDLNNAVPIRRLGTIVKIVNVA